MRFPATAAPLIAVALTISACGGSSSSSTSTGSPSTTPTQGTTAPTVSTPITTSTTSSTRTTPIADIRCTAAKLALTFLGQQGATGHGVLGFALRNRTAASCRTFGFPGVQFLSSSGAPLPTVATRSTNDFGGPAPERSLTVARGASVSFRLVVTHFTSSGSSRGCTTAAALQVIPPDDTASLRVTIPSGAAECGTATVTPLQPGTSAYR